MNEIPEETKRVLAGFERAGKPDGEYRSNHFESLRIDGVKRLKKELGLWFFKRSILLTLDELAGYICRAGIIGPAGSIQDAINFIKDWCKLEHKYEIDIGSLTYLRIQEMTNGKDIKYKVYYWSYDY